MSAEANIIIGEKPGVLLAPSAAESEGHVWRIDGGRARRTQVKLGIRDLLRVEVIDGLRGDDLVVVGGAELLKDGARVTTTVRAPDPLEPLPKDGATRRTSL
jgi:multidrug efflux pump subunit AcrA (membrane-fusion protein)